MNKDLQAPLIARGVYSAPYLSARGRPVILVVNSAHCLIYQKEIGPRMSRAEQYRLAFGILDAMDPPSGGANA